MGVRGLAAQFLTSVQNGVLNSVKRHFFREKMITFAKQFISTLNVNNNAGKYLHAQPIRHTRATKKSAREQVWRA